MDWWYIFFASIRVILTCLPQTGYIHPDEFFQSIEVVAEKSLNFRVNKPWEFNMTFPIRSATPVYLTVGMSYQILNIVNLFLGQQLQINFKNTYFIVLFPRFFICCLSFLVDWSLYKICLANSEKYKSRRLILACSYIILIYGTRTFSNTIELILFSILLYYVAESVIFSNINVRQREYINKRYNSAETVVEKVKFHKLKLFLENDSLRSYFIIATIAAAGFFNRPTFLAYAVIPIFFWIYRGIGFKSIGTMQFHLRIIVFFISTIPAVTFFVIVDSFYFGYLTWGEIGVLQITINNFVVTPWNFIKYNINPANLAKHGLHPRYLHAVVNVPLLFSMLGLMAYSNIVDLSAKLVRTKYHYLPTVRSIKGLMTASFIAPLAVLSIFPHQEPRFLIPLILPLVYLYGPEILPESADAVIKSTTNNIKQKTTKKKNSSYLMFKIWIFINIGFTLFYGFIHQGGIYQFLSNLNKEITSVDDNLHYEIITSHIYSIPQALLCQEINSNTYLRSKRVTFYERGSENIENILSLTENLLQLRKRKKSNFKYKLYLVIPDHLVNELLHYYFKYNLIWKNTVTFYPHISTEALPQLPHINWENFNESLTHPVSSILQFLSNFGLTRIEFALSDI